VVAESDGYALNARIRSSHPIPTTLMVDLLVSLEADMRMARAGRPIPIEQWNQWVRKSHANRDAIVRVLFLITAVRGMSADDVSNLRRDLQQTSKSRQRRPKPIRETGPRESPRLW
jgi:hypothetical protein